MSRRSFLHTRRNGMVEIEEIDNSGCGFLIFGAIILFVIYKLFIVVGDWEQYTLFNKIIAGIYYYICIIPINLIFSPVQYILKNELTQYHNLNLVLTGFNIGVFILLFSFLLKFIASLYSKRFSIINGLNFLLLLFLGPILLWCLVKGISWLFTWIFA